MQAWGGGEFACKSADKLIPPPLLGSLGLARSLGTVVSLPCSEVFMGWGDNLPRMGSGLGLFLPAVFAPHTPFTNLCFCSHWNQTPRLEK